MLSPFRVFADLAGKPCVHHTFLYSFVFYPNLMKAYSASFRLQFWYSIAEYELVIHFEHFCYAMNKKRYA